MAGRRRQGDPLNEPAEEAGTVRLTVGPVAHGGHCVARHEGRVVFVRHALPGEVVDARLTRADPHARFWRADAVTVVVASPDRVAPRCPVSGPGGCGGCDFQHVRLPAQRRLKGEVVAEQLRRLARIDWPEVRVEAVPGDRDGLGWRTRVRFAVDDDGRVGLRRHRSHDVIPLSTCPIAHRRVDEVGVTARRWPDAAAIEVIAGSDEDAAGRDPDRLVVVETRHRDPGPAAASAARARPGQARRRGAPSLAAPAALVELVDGRVERVRGRTWVGETVVVDGLHRRFRVSGAGFWQVHPGAPQALLDAVLATAAPKPGEYALDLYSGVGLFAAGLASRVGERGRVLAVEADDRAVADARRNLHDVPQVELRAARVERDLASLTGPGTPLPYADVVVADPPRSGLGSRVVDLMCRLRPRVIVLVACDPAAMARDVAAARSQAYRLTGLRAFDLFPMTAHVECVATLVRDEERAVVPGAAAGDPAVAT